MIGSNRYMNRTYIVKVILKVCKSFPRDENSTKRLIYGDFVKAFDLEFWILEESALHHPISSAWMNPSLSGTGLGLMVRSWSSIFS